MQRAMNFGPGPSALPSPVLEDIAEEWSNFQGSGTSILEMSHRSQEYDSVHKKTLALVRELLALDDNYTVLLAPGGASTQFSAVPLNLRGSNQSAHYLVTGSWATKAFNEATALERDGMATTDVASGGVDGAPYIRVPKPEECNIPAGSAYVHLTSNNTIAGTQYHSYPTTAIPLVADMSSDFLSRPLDVAPFGLIYAGAQKNIGAAGITAIIIRDDLLERSRTATAIPAMLRYATHAKAHSLYNTPPCFNIYVVGKVLQWIKDLGGLASLGNQNAAKAAKLYATIDKYSDFFRSPVEVDSRSQMNAVFRLPTEILESDFISAAKKAGMIGLKGHRSVGGIRVSMYNGVEAKWVDTLVEFMNEFIRTHG